MYRTATCKVERREVVEPALGVPGPAGDRAVDDRRPAEAKDEGWQDAAALEGTANDNLHCASAELQLVEAEDDLRDVCVVWRRRSGDILETEVGQVPDEGVRAAAVGETVAPEHPLEGCDGCHHDGLEEQAQGALSPGETAIEESNARNDQPDDEPAKDELNVMEFKACILGIDVDFERIAAGRVDWVKLGLAYVSDNVNVPLRGWKSHTGLGAVDIVASADLRNQSSMRAGEEEW